MAEAIHRCQGCFKPLEGTVDKWCKELHHRGSQLLCSQDKFRVASLSILQNPFANRKTVTSEEMEKMQNDLAQHASCCRFAAFHQMAMVHHCRSRAHIHQLRESSAARWSPLPHLLRHNALVWLCRYLNMRISIHSAMMFSGSRVMSSTCTSSNHQLSFFRCPQAISIQVSDNTTLKKILVSLHLRSATDRREIT